MQGRNFKDFRPNVFSTFIEVPQNEGQTGAGTVTIYDRPFIIQRVTHQITRPFDFDPATGHNSYGAVQHGQYWIDWSLYERDRYWAGTPPMADSAFGSVRHGIWQDLPAPIALEKSLTLNVIIGSVQTQRTAYQVQVNFHGVEDYRSYGPDGRLVEG